MKKLIALTFLLIAQNASAEIEEKMMVEQFIYDDISRHPNSYSDAKYFYKYFTKNLRELLSKSARAEALSIKTTPKGDKPCIPDQEIFFSNVEGVSAGKIIAENANQISIRLAYIDSDRSDKTDFTVIKWDEKISLKKENGKLLIDDIIDKDGKSFKTNLANNLKTGCR